MAKTGTQWNFQDKNQRVSRVNSEFLRNSISQHMCQDGSVNLPSQEVDAIIRNLSRKEKKISKLWWALGFAAIFSVALFALTFASALSANEASKESHVDGSNLVDLDGNTVTTGDVESFSSLFDLPRFDAHTLAKITHLSVSLEGDHEGVFEISSVIKSTGCGDVATFYTSDGNKIVVDAGTGLAVAHVEGTDYVIESGSVESERRALYASGEAHAQTYSAEEFFTADNGFGAGRRMEDNAVSGWGSFALAAGKAVLEYHLEGECGQEYDSIYLAGRIVGSGSAMPFEVFYEDEESSKVKLVDAATGDFQVTMYVRGGFTFDNVDGQWTACQALGDDAPSYADAMGMSSDLVVEQGGRIVRAANGKVAEIETVTLGSAGTEIAVPTSQECAAINRDRARRDIIPAADQSLNENRTPAPEGGDRRKLSVLSKKTGWELSQGAYGGGDTPSGFSMWKKCETDHAIAKFYWNNNYEVVAFAGTSGLTDFGDWKDNLDRDHRTENGITTHEGFYEYQRLLWDCVNEGISQNNAWGYKMTHVIGHSLGGAAATVYMQQAKKDAPSGTKSGLANARVMTFGAPKTRVGDSCTVAGDRIAHEKDAISSNVMGLMGDFNHDVTTAFRSKEHSNYCSSDCWLGCCPWGWSWRKGTFSENSCGYNSGGCSWVADCAYYFGTVHLNYGDYL